MKSGLVGLALLASLLLPESAVAGAPGPFVGKKVTLSLKGTTLAAVLEVLADISKRNMVLLDAPQKPTFDLEVKNEPWDQVLDEVVSQAGLAMREEGNLVVVGTAERIDARRQQKRKWVAKRLTLALAEASLSDALDLLSRTGELTVRGGGGKPLRATLRNMPIDQMVAILVELSGGALDTALDAGRPASPAGCAAGESSVHDLVLTATLTGSAQPLAVVRARNGRTFVMEYRGCVGSEGEQVKVIRRNEVETSGPSRLVLGGKASPSE